MCYHRLLVNDLKLQFRHGFYYAYGFLTLFYILFLRLLPSHAAEILTPILLFTDPALLGFYFVGGIMLMEKTEGVREVLFSTPLTPAQYLFSKTATLGLLALLTSVAIVMGVAVGNSTMTIVFRIELLILSIVPTSAFCTSIGAGIAITSDSVNRYMLNTVPVVIVLTIPLLGFFRLLPECLFYPFPTYASLILLRASFTSVPLPLWKIVYAVILLSAAHFVTWRWATGTINRAEGRSN